MNYQESLDYIKSLAPTLERPTMARIRLYFADLGDPQNTLPCLHVGGTNGKGSVTTFLASMLGACGKKVGKFTGPHLTKFNERLVINGQDISDARFAELAALVYKKSQAFAARHPELGPLTWFEFLTAMAVEYFVSEQVDFAVFEVGLGGRFDATSALENILVSTITNVDLDHMHLLGDTVEKIAFEKGGILKKAPLVTAAGGGALQVLLAEAANAAVPVLIIEAPQGEYSADLFKEFQLRIEGGTAEFADLIEKRLRFLRKQVFAHDNLLLSGAYQRLNALTAVISLAVLDYFGDQSKEQSNEQSQFAINICRGLLEAYWPGRYERIESTGQILDGAHNPAGARALRLSLCEMFGAKNFVFIFASFENKDLFSVLSQLVSRGDYVLAPKIAGERPMHKFADIETICTKLGVTCVSFEGIEAAGLEARQLIAAEPGQLGPLAIVTGSFATVREAKAALATPRKTLSG